VDDNDDEQDPDETNEDPIASDSDGYTINADHPICDPREYFLRNVDFRMKQVYREWQNLVRKLERRIDQYVCWRLFLDQKIWHQVQYQVMSISQEQVSDISSRPSRSFQADSTIIWHASSWEKLCAIGDYYFHCS
jgi:hypothetical protein